VVVRAVGRVVVAVGLATAVFAGPVAAEPTELSEPASASAPARRVVPASIGTDLVSVFQSPSTSAEVVARAQAAAHAAGGVGTPRTGFSIGMTQVRRGATVVQAAPSGMRIPMGVTALPAEVAARVMTADVGAALRHPGTVVLGRTSADLRGARAGDTLDLVAAGGGLVTFTVGLVAPDPDVGGAEIVMTTDDARRLGATTVTSVLLWGFGSRSALEAALVAQGLTERADVRIVRSWDPRDPDGGIGLAATKALFGEFAYRVGSDGSVVQDDAWLREHLHCPPGSPTSCRVTMPFTNPLQPGVQPRLRCHEVTWRALEGALADVTAAGLANRLDVLNWNSLGGCHVARFNRLSTSLPSYTTLGWLSRHSWGQAIDVNTCMLDRPIPWRTCSGSNLLLSARWYNCQGCEPGLDCEVVRIFRRWGFAWGGNYLTPDGMHLEYVGEPRDRWPYPSRHCPNEVPLTQGRVAAGPTEREVMFANDGLTDLHS
jgi:hypothetical protein